MIKLNPIALTAGLLAPALAVAQIGVGDPAGTTEAQVRATLLDLGYTIIEMEIEGDEIEAEARLDGVLYEIEVSTARGIVTSIALEEDDA